MKYLFIDDHHVDRIDNLARKLHQPRRFEGNAVLRPEHRWENMYLRTWGAPVWDAEEEIFKMIYLGTAAPDDATIGTGAALKLDAGGDAGASGNHSCYATSADGVNWEKPFLHLYDYPGLTWKGTPVGGENNILPSIRGQIRGPVYHAREADPARRFKALTYRDGHLYTLVSADCIRWQELDVPPQPSADVSELYLDEARDLFVSTVKHRGPYGRSFYLSTSGDFRSWSEQELIFHADQTDQENGSERLRRFFEDPALLAPVHNRPEEWRTDVYHFPVFRYEDLYLGLPVMHHWAGKRPPLFENVDSRKTMELACSRDLRQWERVANRAPFLELSPAGDGSRYDTGQIGSTNGVLRRNGELWIYYTAARRRGVPIAEAAFHGFLDSAAICMARLRLDGFVSLKGGVERGSVLTVPLEVTGPELHLNVDAWRGRVLAEVTDEHGAALPGYAAEECVPAVVDSTDHVVRWRERGSLAELQGARVRVRLSLWQAEVYAFWFGPGGRSALGPS